MLAEEGELPWAAETLEDLNPKAPQEAVKFTTNAKAPYAAEDSSVLGRSKIPPEKRGKTGIGPNLKENLRISGKATLIVIQCSAPDRAVFFSFINHPQQFWDWTDGINVSLVKVDPTRGRRTANAG